MSTISTLKKIAASTAIAASLGVGGLGLASGIASAAPGDPAGTGASTNTEHQAPPAPTTTVGDDATIHAHLIPGFTPKPTPATTPQPVPAHTPRLGNYPGQDPNESAEDRANDDELARCGVGCRETIDE